MPSWDEVVYWAVDLETSGLGRSDTIVAVGAVPLRAGVIAYGERFATLVRQADGARGPGPGIGAHHILPSELEDARPLAEVVEELDARLRGAVLLVHFASIDVDFLRRAYREVGRSWPRPKVVDTVHLLMKLHHRLEHVHAHAPPIPTSLSEARAYLDLPAYPQHDAVTDALATAELFLALRARLEARTLRDLT